MRNMRPAHFSRWNCNYRSTPVYEPHVRTITRFERKLYPRASKEQRAESFTPDVNFRYFLPCLVLYSFWPSNRIHAQKFYFRDYDAMSKMRNRLAFIASIIIDRVDNRN